MVVGTGLGASLGVAAETTYGTYAAPTRFLEYETEDLVKNQNMVQGGGLAAGRPAQLASRRAFTTESASGPVTSEVINKGLGLLFAHLTGSSATPVQQVATPAYLQTHAYQADNVGKSLTLQEGVPDAGGTARVQTFKGAKIVAMEFSCNVDERLMVTTEFDAQRFSEVETLAAPSYPTGVMPFNFSNMGVRLGAYGAEALVTGVKGVSCRVERPQAIDRFYAGAAVPGTKAEPLTNGWTPITGTIEIDYITKADFVDRFHGNAATAMVLEWIMPVAISGAYFPRFGIRLPATFFTAGTPTVDGPDLVDVSVPFEVQMDGINPLVSLEYMSTDMAV